MDNAAESKERQDLRNKPQLKEWWDKAIAHLWQEFRKTILRWIGYSIWLIFGALCALLSLRYLAPPVSTAVLSWILATYTTMGAVLVREHYHGKAERIQKRREEALAVYSQILQTYAIIETNRHILEQAVAPRHVSALLPLPSEVISSTRFAWEIVGESVVMFRYYDSVIRAFTAAIRGAKRQAFTLEDYRDVVQAHEDAAKEVTDVCNRLLFELRQRGLCPERTIFSWDELSRTTGQHWHRRMREHLNDFLEKR